MIHLLHITRLFTIEVRQTFTTLNALPQNIDIWDVFIINRVGAGRNYLNSISRYVSLFQYNLIVVLLIGEFCNVMLIE